MSTAISTVVKTVDFKALSADSRQLRIIEANLDGEPMREQDLVRVKTPSQGMTKWTIEADGNVETVDEIVGLLVGIAKRGTLWPSEDPGESRPVIVSNDLLVGYRVSDDLGSIDPAVLEKYRIGDRRYDWVALADWNGPFGKGSARGGGRRVKEDRILAILREGDVWPILVTVGAGSIQDWITHQKRLPSFHYECVIGLSLTKAKSKGGITYSQIVPRNVGVISEEQGEIARRIYTEPLKRMFSAPPSFGAKVENTAGDEE